MIRDAFDAGVEPGGLHSNREIKMLVCYLLAGVSEPLSRESIYTVLCGNGMANFFNISAAIDDLLTLNNLVEDEQKRLTVTPVGRNAVLTVQDMLPRTLRERSIESANRLLTRLQNERENHVDIVKDERGYSFVCAVGGTENPLMTLSLLVGDEEQARQLSDRFLDDPLSVYKAVIDVLTH